MCLKCSDYFIVHLSFTKDIYVSNVQLSCYFGEKVSYSILSLVFDCILDSIFPWMALIPSTHLYTIVNITFETILESSYIMSLLTKLPLRDLPLGLEGLASFPKVVFYVSLVILLSHLGELLSDTKV